VPRDPAARDVGARSSRAAAHRDGSPRHRAEHPSCPRSRAVDRGRYPPERGHANTLGAGRRPRISGTPGRPGRWEAPTGTGPPAPLSPWPARMPRTYKKVW